MNTLIKKLIKIFSLVLIVGAGTTVFAASFDTNPSGVTGTVSIVEGTCQSCGGQQNSATVSIPNSGDSAYINVFTDFMPLRNSSETVRAARVVYEIESLTGQTSPDLRFGATLRASNAPSHYDTANLHIQGASQYKVEYVSGHIENTHGGRNGCGSEFSYYRTLTSRDIFTSSGEYLGDLPTDGNGLCAQGTVAVKYRITNTEPNNNGNNGNNGNNTVLEVSTESPSNVTDSSADLHGTLVSGDDAKVWFVLGMNSALDCQSGTHYGTRYHLQSGDDFSYHKSGLNPGTRYYYRACALEGNDLDEGQVRSFETEQVQTQIEVETLPATNVTSSSALFSGKLGTGTADLWFVYDYANQSLSCSNSTQRFHTEYARTAPYTMSATKYNLAPNTEYHYKICARDNGMITEGNEVFFSTRDTQTITYTWHHGEWGACIDNMRTREVWCEDSNGNRVDDVNCEADQRPASSQVCDDTKPEAITLSPRDIARHSVRLRGRVDMHDYDNGLVFFVYGTSESLVDSAEYEPSYNSIERDGDRLQKIVVDNDLDSEETYSKFVDELKDGERYYYRICVEYDDTSTELRCGDIEDFKTREDEQTSTEEVIIKTLLPESIGKTNATLCGDLESDGGVDGIRTFIEYREYSISSWKQTSKRDRGEGRFCEDVRSLTPGTKYAYRACTDTGDCGFVRYFTTVTIINEGQKPEVTTDDAYNIRSHSAQLPASYITHAPKAYIWFRYGRSENLNRTTRVYTRYGAGGVLVHNFTNLKANQRYCYQAIIKTSYGTDYGAVKCFTTLPATTTYVPPTKPRIVVVKKDEGPKVDLAKLGLGLSLVQLDIDDQVETVTKGQVVNYEVRWKNISKLNLDNLTLHVQIPREVRITTLSRGRIDRDQNAVIYYIDRLDAGEEDSMSIQGIVENGRLGDVLTAEATLAFDNPVNNAQEDASDYDVDDFVLQTAVGTASVFGLGNITFLGWLVILLGLIILFLIARWLYLEREELRAQAYVNGYGRYIAPGPGAYGGVPPQQPYTPVAPQQTVHHVPAQHNSEGYRPYRPNRG